jgi:hypothetical protein
VDTPEVLALHRRRRFSTDWLAAMKLRPAGLAPRRDLHLPRAYDAEFLEIEIMPELAFSRCLTNEFGNLVDGAFAEHGQNMAN